MAARGASRRGRRLLIALTVWLAPRVARADSFDVGDTSWSGGSEMLEIARSELGEARVRPVAVLDWNEVEPEDGSSPSIPSGPWTRGTRPGS